MCLALPQGFAQTLDLEVKESSNGLNEVSAISVDLAECQPQQTLPSSPNSPACGHERPATLSPKHKSCAELEASNSLYTTSPKHGMPAPTLHFSKRRSKTSLPKSQDAPGPGIHHDSAWHHATSPLRLYPNPALLLLPCVATCSHGKMKWR